MRDSATDAILVKASGGSGRWAECEGVDDYVTDWGEMGDSLPDFRDPGTVGHLLDLVLKAWKVGAVIAEMTDYAESYGKNGGRFEIRDTTSPLFRASGGTRVERLVRALEAAP